MRSQRGPAILVGLLAAPWVVLVALVVGSRAASPTKSWWAWLPLRESPVTLLGCSTHDSSNAVWYGSLPGDAFAVLPVVALVVAMLTAFVQPRSARTLSRIVVALFVVQLSVFGRAWLDATVVGRASLDYPASCDDVLQVSQALSRDHYIDTARVFGVALLLLVLLEVDGDVGASAPVGATRVQPSGGAALRALLTVAFLGVSACAFHRALSLVPTVGALLDLGGLMIVTTLVALPFGLATRPAPRSVGRAGWFVSLALAFSGYSSTWAIRSSHEQSPPFVDGQLLYRTSSDLPDDQLERLFGIEQLFLWWFLGLVALGLLGAVVGRLSRGSRPAGPAAPETGRTSPGLAPPT